MTSSIVSGRLVSKTGRYKPFMIAGVVVTALGIWLLSRMTVDTSRPGALDEAVPELHVALMSATTSATPPIPLTVWSDFV